MRIHFLHTGVAACLMPGVPKEWPAGDMWTPYWQEVTCPECLFVKETGKVPPTLLMKLHAHIDRMAPHQKEREQGRLLIEATAELKRLHNAIDRMVKRL